MTIILQQSQFQFKAINKQLFWLMRSKLITSTWFAYTETVDTFIKTCIKVSAAYCFLRDLVDKEENCQSRLPVVQVICCCIFVGWSCQKQSFLFLCIIFFPNFNLCFPSTVRLALHSDVLNVNINDICVFIIKEQLYKWFDLNRLCVSGT